MKSVYACVAACGLVLSPLNALVELAAQRQVLVFQDDALVLQGVGDGLHGAQMVGLSRVLRGGNALLGDRYPRKSSREIGDRDTGARGDNHANIDDVEVEAQHGGNRDKYADSCASNIERPLARLALFGCFAGLFLLYRWDRVVDGGVR